MFKQTQIGMGDWLGKHDSIFINRTGATISKGQVAMVDILDTQAEVTSIVEGNEDSIFANLTPVVQVSIEVGFPLVVALEDAADNAKCRCRLYGKVEVAVLDDDVSTTDVDKGEMLVCLVSEASTAGGALTTGGGAVQAFTSIAAGSRICGIALEDAAADSTVTARTINAVSHLRWCIWTAGIPQPVAVTGA